MQNTAATSAISKLMAGLSYKPSPVAEFIAMIIVNRHLIQHGVCLASYLWFAICIAIAILFCYIA